MDDHEYDLLHREVVAFECSCPDMAEGAPLADEVGAPAGRSGVRHSSPMLSLDNVFDLEELSEWMSRMGEADLLVEPKLDGLAVSCVYKNGRLVRIATRGDGKVGEDVTKAPVRISGLPSRIGTADMEIRGEVCMSDRDFEEANKARAAAGERPYSNPRNAAAGAIMARGEREAVNVSFRAYDLVGAEDHSHGMSHLESSGVATARQVWRGEEGESVHSSVLRLQSDRRNLGLSIDGAVVKARLARERVGGTSRAPAWAVAYKFPAEQRRSRVESIELRVGRGGSITPVARIEKVEIGGANVTSVSLHNPSEVLRKDIREGDIVYVRRAGDVIPDIVGPVVSERKESSRRWEPPGCCPSCSGPIDTSGGRYKCVRRCGSLRSLSWAASRQALDLEGLGPGVMGALHESGIVTSVADLYTLEGREAEVAGLLVNGRRLGDARARRISSSSHSARTLPLERHILALGVEGVGVEAARALARRFEDISDVAAATSTELQEVDGIGPAIAGNLSSFMRDRRRDVEAVASLVAPGKEPRGGKEASLGLSIAVSGRFETWSRKELVRAAERAGYKVSSQVSSRTHMLVVGADAGRKLRDAEALGVTVVDERSFRGLVEGVQDGAGS